MLCRVVQCTPTPQIKWRLSDEPIAEDEDDELRDPETRKKLKCTIFLGYTSNMISCGVREVIRFLAQHRMVRFTARVPARQYSSLVSWRLGRARRAWSFTDWLTD